jgi:hypothetical protein
MSVRSLTVVGSVGHCRSLSAAAIAGQWDSPFWILDFGFRIADLPISDCGLRIVDFPIADSDCGSKHEPPSHQGTKNSLCLGGEKS